MAYALITTKHDSVQLEFIGKIKDSKTMKYKISLAMACFGLSVASLPAHAVFINGSMSVSDSLVSPFGLVSVDTDWHLDDSGFVSTPSGDFDTYLDGAVPGPASSFSIGAGEGFVDTAAPGGTLFTAGGFTFDLSAAGILSTTSLSCTLGQCTDARTVGLLGQVAGNGFDSTAWTGVLTLNGACGGAGGACTDQNTYSPSWSLSLTALGRPTTVPEPSTLALLGIGLLGFGVTRLRRRPLQS
jgi:hypothetical protein